MSKLRSSVRVDAHLLSVEGTAPIGSVSCEFREEDADDRTASDVDGSTGSPSSIVVSETAVSKRHVRSDACDANASTSAIGIQTAVEHEGRVGDDHAHRRHMRSLDGLKQHPLEVIG